MVAQATDDGAMAAAYFAALIANGVHHTDAVAMTNSYMMARISLRQQMQMMAPRSTTTPLS